MNGRSRAIPYPETIMDIPRKEAGRKKLIRRIILAVIILAAIPAITVGLSRLKPAAPGVERSTVWSIP